jgi:phytoene dehydrogenase-like protein
MDLESEFGVTGGHLFHGEHAPDQLLSFRPVAAAAQGVTEIAGLFLGGGGAHPGGGITCGPGWFAARAALSS